MHVLQVPNGKNTYTFSKIYTECDNFLVQKSSSLCQDYKKKKEHIEIYVSIFFYKHQSLNKK